MLPRPSLRFSSILRPAALMAAVLTGACAAAMPGYVPEGSRNKAFDRVKTVETGAVNAAGLYIPSADERALDCKKLTGSMKIIIARIKEGRQTPQPSSLSAAAQAVVSTVRGKTLMQDASAIDQRERARLDAYNRLLAEKQCPTMPIAAELSSPSVAANGKAGK